MVDWQRNVPLASRTTLEVGGPALHYVDAPSVDAVIEALDRARALELDVTVLGGGSNVLIADAGIAGLVLHPTETTIELDGERVRATAGVHWDALVERCVAEELAGLECLSGIPGQVGAAPMQNIGAYGREIGESIEAVEVVNRRTLTPTTLTADECRFGYRTSAFKTVWRDEYVITAVHLRLEKNGRPELRYRDLLARFASRTPAIHEVRRGVLDIRRAKSMVWDRGDPNHRSAGSFFTNPIVSPKIADRVDEITRESVPRYPTAGAVKLPAAWLIERAGFTKGYQRGRAGISTAHALALINRGDALAAEIAELAREIQSRVLATFEIALKPEPVWLGFTDRDRERPDTESP